MIRVLHVLGGLERGGAETMVLNIYRAIDRRIVQFDFIIHTTEHQAYYDEIINLGGKIYSFPAFNGKNTFQLRHLWNTFFIEHPEYKILHSHVRSYASLYLPIAKKYGVKTIIHSHSTSNGKGVTSIVKRVLQYPLRYQADYLMACSNEAGRWLFGEKACKRSNYYFIPNAIDVEQYQFTPEIAEQYRKALGIQGKFVVGHVGRFHEAKNHFFLLDIFAEVSKKRADAMLLLVGDGNLRYAIETKIHDLKLEGRVVLTGNRDDVPQLMSAMDVFVFPSVWEGLPVTVVEAQASGLHCLISDQITKDVDTTELVERLSIDNVKLWVDHILNVNVDRMDVMRKVKQAGFDVKDSAAKLKEFYSMIN